MLSHLMITDARVELSTARVGRPLPSPVVPSPEGRVPMGLPAGAPSPSGRLLLGLLLAGGVAVLATLLTPVLAACGVGLFSRRREDLHADLARLDRERQLRRATKHRTRG